MHVYATSASLKAQFLRWECQKVEPREKRGESCDSVGGSAILRVRRRPCASSSWCIDHADILPETRSALHCPLLRSVQYSIRSVPSTQAVVLGGIRFRPRGSARQSYICDGAHPSHPLPLLRREPWRGKSTGWAEPPASQRVLGVLFELLSHPFKSRRAHQTHSHHIACCRAMTTRPHGWL